MPPAGFAKGVCPRLAGQLSLKLRQIAEGETVLCSLDCLFCTAPTSRREPKGTRALLLSQRNEELRVDYAATQCLAFSDIVRFAALDGEHHDALAPSQEFQPVQEIRDALVTAAHPRPHKPRARSPERRKDFARQALSMAGTLRRSPLAEKITTFDTAKKRFCVFLRMEPFWGNGFSLH